MEILLSEFEKEVLNSILTVVRLIGYKIIHVKSQTKYHYTICTNKVDLHITVFFNDDEIVGIYFDVIKIKFDGVYRWESDILKTVDSYKSKKHIDILNEAFEFLIKDE